MFAQGDWLPLWEQGKDEVTHLFRFLNFKLNENN